ncbi:Na+/melibiose symporter [Rhodococcoides kyotonense]|uniref:Na+/melibiose symporter n=1 Tax=Rhodococcoides kyotonense TaxID=398843 RepID=A0A239L430_9NOCA|nr:Na+/melibiose symporter [Rhodococcus kyotonensis]
MTAGYGAGSLGTGGFAALPGLVLAYYLTDTLGVAAAIASLVLVVPKIWDVALGPLVGALSDRRSATTGSRSRGMLFGAVAMPILFVLTFAPPVGLAPAVWVFVFFLLAATVYSFFQVPYIALPTELFTRSTDRTRLVSVRIAVLAAAILLVGGGGPAVRDAAGGGPRGYLLMAVAAALVMGVGMVVTVRFTHEKSVTRAGDVTGSIWSQYREGLGAVRSTPSFRNLLIVFVVQALAVAILLAGAQYLATYVLGDESALTGLFLAVVGPALLVMPAWYRLGLRYGRMFGYVVASLLFVCAALSFVGTLWSPGSWVYISAAVAGVGYAGMQVFPLALLPDTVEDDAALTGRSRAGALSGVWTAAETGGQALGPAIFLLMLAFVDFRSSRTDEVVVQPDSVVPGIVMGCSVIPGVLVLVSLAALRHFRVPQEAAV